MSGVRVPIAYQITEHGQAKHWESALLGCNFIQFKMGPIISKRKAKVMDIH